MLLLFSLFHIYTTIVLITEEEKYRAETSRLVGIGMLTPFGAFLLTPIILFKQLGLLNFAIYLIISIAGLVIGAMIIEYGRKILDKREIRRWQ